MNHCNEEMCPEAAAYDSLYCVEHLFNYGGQPVRCAIVELEHLGEPIDVVTVINKLHSNGMLGMAGGPYLVQSLWNMGDFNGELTSH